MNADGGITLAAYTAIMLQQGRQVKSVRGENWQAYPRWQVIIRWVVATVIGGTVAIAIVYWTVVQSYVTDFGDVDRAREVMFTGMNALGIYLKVGLFLLYALGVSIGFVQWFILNQLLPLTWSLVSLGGWAGFVIVAFLFGAEECTAPIGLLLGGLILSSVQWIALRPLSLRQSAYFTWVGSNALGSLLGWLASWITGVILVSQFGSTDFFSYSYLRYAVVILAVGLLVFSIITGIALVRILSVNGISKNQ